jgi:hypothetical protein
MKTLVIFIAFFSLHTYAAETQEKLGFRCTSKMPTTSFILEEQGAEMVLTMIHHNGVDFMPIHQGIIVPHDLGFLAEKAKILTRLGSRNEFRFPRSRCTSYGAGLLSCSRGERKNIGGLDVEALNIMTSVNTRKVFDEKIEYYGVNLSLNVAGNPPVSELSMEYATDECKFGL